MWRDSGWFDRIGAGGYDFVVERERLARVLGKAVWGADTRLLYAAMRTAGSMPDGSAILDVPCGGGVAFRGLRSEQDVRYVAADLSPGMLRRARRVAERLGLEDRIEFAEADVEALQFEDGSFDLVVCFSGVHCFGDPAVAIRELGRVLKPGGRLVGDFAARGEGARFDRLISAYAKRGIFGPGGTAAELERWLAEAGFGQRRVETSGAIAYFNATRSE
jgi:ubiquinone/menaquinone biosynthesis C-methylase UbiE